MKLSVLMSVYSKESPVFLRQCLDSLVAQTLPAGEIVVVKDGPLGSSLEDVIASYKLRLPIVSLSLPANVGLGEALRAGLTVCRGDYVARMDSDDISVPERLLLQMAFLESNCHVDVVGGAWAEFDHDPSNPHSVRILPATGDALLRYAKLRTPMNHPTIVFRKASVVAAGSYESFIGFEDYHLFARMLLRGCCLHNLEQTVLYHRVGNGMLDRRRGYEYLKREIESQVFLHGIGFLTAAECIRNILLRAPVRLMPAFAVGLCYKHLLRTRAAPRSGRGLPASSLQAGLATAEENLSRVPES
jgi:glycosyltransferase involved in cell wall biosynthesis